MSRFTDSAARLAKVAWGSAPEWDDRALKWWKDYYRRLLPSWPSGRGTLPPAAPDVVASAFAGRGATEREQIYTAVASIKDAARKRAEEIESTSRELLPAILAWSLAVDASNLAAGEDPGEPLLELFEAGFQLIDRHEGIHILYQSGWRIYQPPSRASLG